MGAKGTVVVVGFREEEDYDWLEEDRRGKTERGTEREIEAGGEK